MTPIEILILIYGLIGIGVGIGSYISDKDRIEKGVNFVTSIVFGLLWVVTIPVRITIKLS